MFHAYKINQKCTSYMLTFLRFAMMNTNNAKTGFVGSLLWRRRDQYSNTSIVTVSLPVSLDMSQWDIVILGRIHRSLSALTSDYFPPPTWMLTMGTDKNSKKKQFWCSFFFQFWTCFNSLPNWRLSFSLGAIYNPNNLQYFPFALITWKNKCCQYRISINVPPKILRYLINV